MKARLLLLALPVVAFACADSTTTNRARHVYEGTLAVDIRGSVDLAITETSAEDVDVSLAFADGYGLLDPKSPLTAHGKLEKFPEAPGWENYTARFASSAIPSGPCGESTVSLALSLVRRDKNARLYGALTAYCGSSYSGVPARVLRLSGTT